MTPNFPSRLIPAWLSVTVRVPNRSVSSTMTSGRGDTGNYATTEYLLCGLPVVSTGSKGGRNEWLDPEFCRIVPADAQCIAAAVAELAAEAIDHMKIRGVTLARMARHRRKFCGLVQQIYSAFGAGCDFGREFYGIYAKAGKVGWLDPGDGTAGRKTGRNRCVRPLLLKEEQAVEVKQDAGRRRERVEVDPARLELTREGEDRSGYLPVGGLEKCSGHGTAFPSLQVRGGKAGFSQQKPASGRKPEADFLDSAVGFASG